MAYKQIASYNPLTDLQSQQFLSQFLPKGKLFAQKNTSTSILYKLLYCIADWIKQITSQIYVLIYNRSPYLAVELLPECEASVGIGTVIPRLSTIAQRQTAVVTLLSKIPIINIVPYAAGPIDYNSISGQVLCWPGTAGIPTDTTTITISGATQSAFNGTFTITAWGNSPLRFTLTFATGLSLVSDNVVYNIPFTGNINTTIEQYVYNLTGLTIHISTLPQNGNNSFKCPFPITFGLTRLQSLLAFQIYVVGSSLPTSTINLLNTVLSRVMPSFCTLSYTLVSM